MATEEIMDEEADERGGAETKEARWVGRIVSTWDLDLDGRQALEALKVHDRHHLAGRGRAVVQDRSKTHSGDEVSIPPELRGTGHCADHCNDRDCGALHVLDFPREALPSSHFHRLLHMRQRFVGIPWTARPPLIQSCILPLFRVLLA